MTSESVIIQTWVAYNFVTEELEGFGIEILHLLPISFFWLGQASNE
jgi:hypothetical protein